jgi:hypothetical protein
MLHYSEQAANCPNAFLYWVDVRKKFNGVIVPNRSFLGKKKEARRLPLYH